jgi:hypothetical protein
MAASLLLVWGRGGLEHHRERAQGSPSRRCPLGRGGPGRRCPLGGAVALFAGGRCGQGAAAPFAGGRRGRGAAAPFAGGWHGRGAAAPFRAAAPFAGSTTVVMARRGEVLGLGSNSLPRRRQASGATAAMETLAGPARHRWPGKGRACQRGSPGQRAELTGATSLMAMGTVVAGSQQRGWGGSMFFFIFFCKGSLGIIVS